MTVTADTATMPSIAPLPEGESFFSLPIAEFQRALDALVPLLSKAEDDIFPLHEIILAGTAIVAMDRYMLGRWATTSHVSIDGSYRASGIVFGDAFTIPTKLRTYISAIRARELTGSARHGSLAEHELLLRHVGDSIHVSIRTPGKTLLPINDGATTLTFAAGESRVAPVERILKPFSLREDSRISSVPWVDPDEPFVTPTWPVRVSASALGKLARYEKKYKTGPVELNFARENGPVHFQCGDRFDGIMMLPRA